MIKGQGFAYCVDPKLIYQVWASSGCMHWLQAWFEVPL